MTEIKNYKIDIIERTKELLENNYESFRSKDREATFLLNCLLGLVVAISENEKRKLKVFLGKIDDSFLELLPYSVGFVDSVEIKDNISLIELTDINIKIGHKNELKEKSKLWFINKIRNSIAHQNITAINEHNKWVGIRLFNTNKSKKDFEISFTIPELKIFAIGLSHIYLNI